jgi:hypothetical protein
LPYFDLVTPPLEFDAIMEVRSRTDNRSVSWLAKLLLLVAWFLPGGPLPAQGIGLPGGGELRRLPPVDVPEVEPPGELEVLGSVRTVSMLRSDEELIDSLASDEGAGELPLQPLLPDYASDLSYELFGRPYNYVGSGTPEQTGWIVGAGDHMGIFTLGLAQRGWWRIGENHIQFNPAVHFVSGPRQTDLPPRLYDFDIGFVRRDTIFVPELTYEVAVRPGFFTDFEGNARAGLRVPGHAVMFLQVSDERQVVLGVDYLDRDDLRILPVFGASFHLTSDLWVEAIFPKPRIAFRLGSERWLYLAARMGGGTWAIERVWRADDVVTYRDFQAVLGIQQDHLEGHSAFLEFGMVFGRRLEYRSGMGDFQPKSTAIVRTVLRY